MSSKTYEYSGNTTEWEDILIKKGITTREDVLLSKGLNPDDFIKKEDPVQPHQQEADRSERLHEFDVDGLDELEDEDEFADTRILDAYRQIRLNELREAAVKNRFGELVDIVKNDWIREVTDASVLCTVIVHLYEDSLVECQLVDEAMRTLAPRFKYLKFLRIKSTHAIENWPEKNLPAIFIYADGVMKMQIVTLAHLYGKSMKAADLEWYLVEKGVITDSELDDNPRLSNPNSSALKVSSSVFRHVSSNRDSDDDDNYEDD